MSSHEEDHGDQYHPVDAVGKAVTAALITGSAGGFVSGVQNTLAAQNRGAWGFITRTGVSITTFTAVGAIYEFTKCAAANLREKEDPYNYGIGGFFGGAVMGLRFRSMPMVLGYGALSATALTAFNFTGNAFRVADDEEDEYERKQRLRKARRRPVEDTIAEIGEGRGVYGPGYTERRAQRLKERYGIDVPAS